MTRFGLQKPKNRKKRSAAFGLKSEGKESGGGILSRTTRFKNPRKDKREDPPSYREKLARIKGIMAKLRASRALTAQEIFPQPVQPAALPGYRQLLEKRLLGQDLSPAEEAFYSSERAKFAAASKASQVRMRQLQEAMKESGSRDSRIDELARLYSVDE